MRLDCALICDAATVRDGLLHILGGGVTRVARGEFPGPLGVAIALRVEISQQEADHDFAGLLRMLLRGEEIGRVGVGFSAAPDDRAKETGEALYVALALPTYLLPVPEPGEYVFEFSVDGDHLGSLLLFADHHLPNLGGTPRV